jgi:phosphatidylglycerophosphate synthase
MSEWSEDVYHKISKPFINLMVRLGITANQLTIFNHAMTLTAGVWFFSRGTWLGYLIGLAVCVINGFLDYADGDIARATGKCSRVGEWLDTGFDVVIQNSVMAAIALGCYRQGMGVIWILLYFVNNAGLNLVSFNYNHTFGFSSRNGNELFRKYMLQKKTIFNAVMLIVIDPTINFGALFLFTVRYWIVIGAVFNKMPTCFIVLVFLGFFRWGIMFVVYALHLMKYKKLWVSQALAILDEERSEFYKCRMTS